VLYDQSALYRAIYHGLEGHRSASRPSQLNVRKLASDLGVSHWAPYHWFKVNRLPLRHIIKLIALEASTLTLATLIPLYGAE